MKHDTCYIAGVVNTEGPPWKEQRRFALSSLRDFGMGKHSLEHKIHEELQFFTEEVKKKDGQAFDITFLMNKAISNIICSIVFGERYDYEDAYFNEMIELLHLTVKNAIRAVLTNRIPLIRYLPGDPTRVSRNSELSIEIYLIYLCYWEVTSSHMSSQVYTYDKYTYLWGHYWVIHQGWILE